MDKSSADDKQLQQQQADIFALALQQFEQRRKAEDELQISSNNREFRRQDATDGTGVPSEAFSHYTMDNPSENTLIICGSPNCGKTSAINRFLDSFSGRSSTSSEPNERTIALKYRFGTRMARGNFKQLVHIWELAGGGTMSSLLDNVLNQRSINSTSILMFLDLTRPELFQSIVESIFSVCRKRIESLMPTGVKANGRIPSADKQIVRPLGIPTVIICARYDEFQNLDSERKRNTFRLIRLLAHINGAEIATFSLRMDALLQKMRLTMMHLATNPLFLALSKSLATDPQQPLFVMPHGSDSIEAIDPSLRHLGSFSEAMMQFLHSLNQQFAQQKVRVEAEAEEEENAGESKQFAEPTIDALVEERMRRLELFAREKRDRQEAERRAAERRLID